MLRPLRPALVLLALTACGLGGPKYATPHDFFEKLGYGAMCPAAQVVCHTVAPSTPEQVFKVTGLPERRWKVEQGETIVTQHRYALELPGLSLYIGELGGGDVALMAQVIPDH